MVDMTNAANQAADQISMMRGIAQANNAASAEQARIQREWQEKQNAKAMTFNANEAAKNRNWQEMMSNTAHQREVKDLLAAGLNPVLSAMNGNGAAVTSGATASGVTSAGAKGEVDTSASGAIANLLGSILAANTQLESANINARSQEAVAAQYTAMSKIVAEINAESGKQIADMNREAAKYAADKSFDSYKYSSNRSADASKYGADKHYYGSVYSANQNYNSAKYNADTQWDIKNVYGNNPLTGLAGWLGNHFANMFGVDTRSAGK